MGYPAAKPASTAGTTYHSNVKYGKEVVGLQKAQLDFLNPLAKYFRSWLMDMVLRMLLQVIPAA